MKRLALALTLLLAITSIFACYQRVATWDTTHGVDPYGRGWIDVTVESNNYDADRVDVYCDRMPQETVYGVSKGSTEGQRITLTNACVEINFIVLDGRKDLYTSPGLRVQYGYELAINVPPNPDATGWTIIQADTKNPPEDTNK